MFELGKPFTVRLEADQEKFIREVADKFYKGKLSDALRGMLEKIMKESGWHGE